MISIKNLVKTYRNGKDQTSVALKNIDLSFNETGIVFITGKSGSGKTTLLNILGLLDDFDSGEIKVGGISLKGLKDSESSDYRNEVVGFIFQDYNLIDSISIKENIKISLSLIEDNKQNKDQAISNILDEVGLSGFERRRTSTLSAGQKQRVAIARAIIKKPKILLCDEPTGNLDSKTSKSILELLKKLSKDLLVIIVSHNNDDALLYGDRIIELKDGSIVSDLCNSSSSFYEIKEQTLYINDVSLLSEEQLSTLNSSLKDCPINNIQSKKDLFIRNTEVSKENVKLKLKKTSKNYKLSWSLAKKFQKHTIVSNFLTSMITSLIVVILGLSQLFISFDSSTIIKETIMNQDRSVFVMKKGVFEDELNEKIDTSTLIRLNQDDYEYIHKSGYNSEVYSLINYSLPISLKSWMLSSESTLNDSNNIGNFYAQEGYGVLPINEDTLGKIFPSFSYIGDLNDKEYGIIITDYIADSILHYRSDTYKSYENILGPYKNKSTSTYCYINAIINTGYKTKHKYIFDRYLSFFNDPTSINISDLILTDQYLSFYEDVKSILGISYALNENFLEASRSYKSRNIARLDNILISFQDVSSQNIYLNDSWAYNSLTYGRSLPENTLSISLSTFNKLFFDERQLEIDEAKVFNGTEINLTKYDRYHPNDEIIFQKTVKIDIVETGYYSFLASEDLFVFLRQYDMLPFAIYLDDIANANKVYTNLKQRGFVPYSSVIEASEKISDVVNIFSNFFALIFIILVTGISFTLVLNTYLSLFKRKKDIGILKALGMKNISICSIFVFQILFVVIFSSLFFGISFFGFTKLTNNILFDSFMNYFKNPALKKINILSFNPSVMILDIAIMLIFSLLAVLLPFIFTKKVKPLNIILDSQK